MSFKIKRIIADENSQDCRIFHLSRLNFLRNMAHFAVKGLPVPGWKSSKLHWDTNHKLYGLRLGVKIIDQKMVQSLDSFASSYFLEIWQNQSASAAADKVADKLKIHLESLRRKMEVFGQNYPDLAEEIHTRILMLERMEDDFIWVIEEMKGLYRSGDKKIRDKLSTSRESRQVFFDLLFERPDFLVSEGVDRVPPSSTRARLLSA